LYGLPSLIKPQGRKVIKISALRLKEDFDIILELEGLVE
jgi:hypothetical protein